MKKLFILLIFLSLGCSKNQFQSLTQDTSLKTIEDLNSDDLAPNQLRVFVSKNLYLPSQLNGIEGANALCTSIAKSAGLTRTYVAILSSTTSNIVDNLELSEKSIYTVSTTKELKMVIEQAENLFSGSVLSSPININEYGEVVEDTISVYTGTSFEGKSAGSDITATCEEWTSDSEESYVGDYDAINSSWIESADSSCSDPKHIYCISQ